MRFPLFIAALMAATSITPALITPAVAQDAEQEAREPSGGVVMVDGPAREQRQSERQVERQESFGGQAQASDPAREARRDANRAERRTERQDNWQGSGLDGVRRVMRQANPIETRRDDSNDRRADRRGQPQFGGRDDGRLIEHRRDHDARREGYRDDRQGYGSRYDPRRQGYANGYGQTYGYGQGYSNNYPQTYGYGYGYGYGQGYGYNQGYTQGYGTWNRDWRRDRRYDWQRYRYANRDQFSIGRYSAPYGWSYGYRRFTVGIALSQSLFSQRYWIDDPYAFRLPQAYEPYRWVRYYDDVLLVDLRTGQVVDAIYDFFE